MKKLDELDSYIRTQIKKEIRDERNDYVTIQRNEIESKFNEKIQEKPTFDDIKQ
jgi:hypothetical protein